MSERVKLADAASASTLKATDCVFAEVDGSIRRITVTDLAEAISSGGVAIRLYAWGIPIKAEIQTSPEWGVIGNTDMRDAYLSKVGRYHMSADGSRMAKLSATDSTVYADGTALDNSTGHTMVYGPRLYYLLQDDDSLGCPVLWLSELPIGKRYVEAPVVGAYKASLGSGNCLTSRSGVSPRVSTTIRSFWEYAQNNGADFGLVSWEHRKWLMMLVMSEFGSPNDKAHVGNGLCGSTSVDVQTEANALLTGATDSLGDATGRIDVTLGSAVDPCHVSVRGVENPWGWQGEMTQGCYFGSADNDGQDGTEAFFYQNNYVPTTDEVKLTPDQIAAIKTGDWRKLTRNTTSSYQWAKAMAMGEWFDLLATTVGASSSSCWTTCYYGSSTGQLLSCGGRATHGAYFSLGFVYSHYAWTASYSYSGSRLAYYGPTPAIVPGAAM